MHSSVILIIKVINLHILGGRKILRLLKDRTICGKTHPQSQSYFALKLKWSNTMWVKTFMVVNTV